MLKQPRARLACATGSHNARARRMPLKYGGKHKAGQSASSDVGHAVHAAYVQRANASQPEPDRAQGYVFMDVLYLGLVAHELERKIALGQTISLKTAS